MFITHIGALKVTAWIVGVATAIILVDPTLNVAIIVGITAVSVAVINSGTSLFLRRLDRKDRQELLLGQKKMQASVDGKLDQLIYTKGQLASAQGRREGIEAEQDRQEKT